MSLNLFLESSPKIIVTGGSGIIGSRLIEKLMEKGYTNITNLDVDTGFDLVYYPPFKILEDADYIFHLAAIKNGDLSPQQAFRNFKMADGIASGIYLKYPKVIFPSSSHIYSLDAKTPIKESENIEPRDYYGFSKIASEEILKKVFGNHGLVILRITNVFSPKFKKHGILSNFFNSFMKNEPLEIYDEGKIKRDRIWIDDAVDALILAMKPEASGIYNIGTGCSYSTFEVAKFMADILKKPLEYKNMESSNKMQELDNRLCCAKVKKELNFIHQISLQKGLELMLEQWVKEYEIL